MRATRHGDRTGRKDACERALRGECTARGRRGRTGEAPALPQRARGARLRAGVTGAAWLESLSPWPEEFGLGRMRELLAELGEPQRAFPAIHVVGTNGKTSTTLMTAAILHAEGLQTGAYISPHLRGWAERIQIDGADADLEAALARVRP